MDNENITETELSAFDDGWDDVDTSETDSEAETLETETKTDETEEDADQQETEEEVSEDETEEQNEDEEKTEADQSKSETFELKYMGETLKVGKNEVIALAQMGKDYDRVKAQRDEGKDKISELETRVGELSRLESFIDEMCAASNMKREDFIDASRANLLVQQEKDKGRELSPELALEWAAKQRQQSEAAAAAEPKAEEETPAQSVEEAKRTDDFTKFAMAFPDVDAEKIPQSVWDEYRETGSLVAPYALYENKQLKEKIKALEQNQKNRERSTGSRSTSGGKKVVDIFDAEWDD